ncbi:MAG: globin [Mariniphaga sp.]|nr:globin [Mariniphaga sp.]
MNFLISEYKQGEHPQVSLPTTQIYVLLQEEGMRKMISDFYDLLIQSKISNLFPKNPIALEKAKEHSADFFIQICGGPQYFNQNRGNPMMARRHAPHPITPEARIIWLECYREVLQKLDLPEDIILSFWNYLDVFSKWMVNTKSNKIEE